MVKYLHYCRMSIKKKGYNITLGIFIGLIAGVIIGIIMPEWANMGIECGFHYLYVGIKNDDFPNVIKLRNDEPSRYYCLDGVFI